MAEVKKSGPQLQRSSVSFRRQGSSGLVWNDRFFSGELARPKAKVDRPFFSGELPRRQRRLALPQRHSDHHHHQDIEADEEVNAVSLQSPPSPRRSGCGCCGCGVLRKPSPSRRNVRIVKSRTR